MARLFGRLALLAVGSVQADLTANVTLTPTTDRIDCIIQQCQEINSVDDLNNCLKVASDGCQFSLVVLLNGIDTEGACANIQEISEESLSQGIQSFSMQPALLTETSTATAAPETTETSTTPETATTTIPTTIPPTVYPPGALIKIDVRAVTSWSPGGKWALVRQSGNMFARVDDLSDEFDSCRLWAASDEDCDNWEISFVLTGYGAGSINSTILLPLTALSYQHDNVKSVIMVPSNPVSSGNVEGIFYDNFIMGGSVTSDTPLLSDFSASLVVSNLAASSDECSRGCALEENSFTALADCVAQAAEDCVFRGQYEYEAGSSYDAAARTCRASDKDVVLPYLFSIEAELLTQTGDLTFVMGAPPAEDCTVTLTGYSSAMGPAPSCLEDSEPKETFSSTHTLTSTLTSFTISAPTPTTKSFLVHFDKGPAACGGGVRYIETEGGVTVTFQYTVPETTTTTTETPTEEPTESSRPEHALPVVSVASLMSAGLIALWFH